MISAKIRDLLAAAAVAIALTACGGGIDLDENSSTHQPSQGEVRETAIGKIKVYAISNGSNSDIPQVQDYRDAGVSGVDEENLEDINRIISGLTAEDVNNSDKIQSLIDKFKLVIDIPIMISENNVSVYENNITAIKLFAIGKDTVYYHIYDLDTKYFDLNTTTGLVVFRKAPDYERKRSYQFYATAEYASGVISVQVLITITILDREESAEIIYRDTEYNTVVSPHTGRVWLDRNIGASFDCIAHDDISCYGDYFQWGRMADGHETASSATTQTQEDELTASSDNFVTGSADWLSTDTEGVLRQSVWAMTDGSTVCPAGFRVPILKELEAETTALQSPTNSNLAAFASFLKLPSSGYRAYRDGTVYPGAVASLWVNSVEGSHAMHLSFLSSRAYKDNAVRSRGLPIRCIQHIPDTQIPVFTSPSTFQVKENNTSASFTVVATDQSALHFTIEGTDAGSFSIDALTGVVEFENTPDYEQKPSYHFTAVATDSSGNRGEQNVTVKILDNNAEIPLAFTSPSSVNVLENSSIAMTLHAASETYVHYTLEGDDASLFQVHSQTGVVTFIDLPDFESGKTTYSFVAIVTDATMQETRQTITINILDADETIEMTHNGIGYGTVISPHTGRVWLDRNLGASRLCTSYDDASCFGDYYQWGRGTDGHQIPTSRYTKTPIADIDHPGLKFFIKDIGASDWTTDDANGTRRMERWAKTDGSSICPTGYRVPSINELRLETISVGLIDASAVFESFLKLPSGEERTRGLFNPNDTRARRGSVYANTLDNNGTSKPMSLQFSKNTGYPVSYITAQAVYAMYGINVRCIKD